jgi:hypothetical protein
MKALISILIVLGAIYGLKSLFSYYKKVNKEETVVQAPANPTTVKGEDLPGLPSTFEASLQEAQKGGAAGLRNWLNLYRTYIKDPRLAWIELDYVVLVSQQDPKEARAVFHDVKSRTPPSSPVYERIKKLEKTYD